MFELYINYGLTLEMASLQSIYLNDYVDKIVTSKLAPMDDKLTTPQVLVSDLAKRLELAYKNLIDLKQFKRCYQFILHEVTDQRWFSAHCEPMDVAERITWLGKAKSAMEMVPEREQD